MIKSQSRPIKDSHFEISISMFKSYDKHTGYRSFNKVEAWVLQNFAVNFVTKYNLHTTINIMPQKIYSTKRK